MLIIEDNLDAAESLRQALELGGHEVAVAYTGADGIARNYTSARLLTAATFTQTYGRFEARMRLPYGQGIWPAFWMLGNDIGAVGWPACGEIDVMEMVGYEPNRVFGTLHGPVLGAVLYVFLKEYLALRWVDFHLLIFGALFIAIVLLLPGGLVQAAERARRLLAR